MITKWFIDLIIKFPNTDFADICTVNLRKNSGENFISALWHLQKKKVKRNNSDRVKRTQFQGYNSELNTLILSFSKILVFS